MEALREDSVASATDGFDAPSATSAAVADDEDWE
jgi:hypothetical protein